MSATAPASERAVGIRVRANELKAALNNARLFVIGGDNDKLLHGILLEAERTSVQFTASDTYALIRHRLYCETFKGLQGWRFVLSGDDAAALCALLRSRKEHVTLRYLGTGPRLTITNDHWEVTFDQHLSPNAHTDWPRVQHMFVSSSPRTSVAVGGWQLGRLAKIVPPDHHGEVVKIVMEHTADYGPIKYTVGPDVDGLLMPLRT